MFSNNYYPVTYARSNVKGGKDFPNITGTVEFTETKEGIIMTAKINGLPTTHNSCHGRFFGFHIHNGTSCSGTAEDEFANSLTHYNPTGCMHPFHAGDLPPLLENNGYAYMSVLINKFRIQEILGKVIVIHDLPDDFTTQPSGNSGKKIACGKIVI